LENLRRTEKRSVQASACLHAQVQPLAQEFVDLPLFILMIHSGIWSFISRQKTTMSLIGHRFGSMRVMINANQDGGRLHPLTQSSQLRNFQRTGVAENLQHTNADTRFHDRLPCARGADRVDQKIPAVPLIRRKLQTVVTIGLEMRQKFQQANIVGIAAGHLPTQVDTVPCCSHRVVPSVDTAVQRCCRDSRLSISHCIAMMAMALFILPSCRACQACCKDSTWTRMSSFSSGSPWIPPAPLASTRPQYRLMRSVLPPGLL